MRISKCSFLRRCPVNTPMSCEWKLPAEPSEFICEFIQRDCMRKPLPIVMIGAGGIVRNAHLPAYRKGGLPVCGDHRSACGAGSQGLAADWGIGIHGATLRVVCCRNSAAL